MTAADPNPTDAALAALAAARDLLASIDHDNSGEVIGLQRVGGNGGLISRTTTIRADALRRALDRLEQAS